MTFAVNLNAPMSDENGRRAIAASQAAMRQRRSASARERALIEALATRFAADPVAPRPPLDRAYADAMAAVAAAYSADPDVQTLYADAVMNTMAWDYWQKDGSLKPEAAPHSTALEARDRPASRSCRRASLLRPSRGGVADAGTGGGQRRSPRATDAGRRSHRPHAGAHLPARRPLRRRGRGQRARHRRRRGLPGAVPGAGALSGELLPAQPALPVGSGDARRTQRRGDRRGAPGGGEGAAPPRRRAGLDRRFPRDAVARLRALRPVAGDADRAEAAGHRAVRHGHLALRARRWRSSARDDARARQGGAGGARPRSWSTTRSRRR